MGVAYGAARSFPTQNQKIRFTGQTKVRKEDEPLLGQERPDQNHLNPFQHSAKFSGIDSCKCFCHDMNHQYFLMMTMMMMNGGI